MNKINSGQPHETPSPEEVAVADHDVRYVPSQAGTADFCGLAHESRYAWVVSLQNLSGKTVLDFGCGSGYGTNMLASRATLVHGLDYSPQAISFAASRYKKSNVTYHCVDAASSGQVFSLLKPRAYDLITSFDVIEHIAAYRDYLANIAGLIKKDGTLIIGCPNRLQTLNWNRTWNPYHKQEFGPRRFRELLLDYFEEVTLLSQDFRDPGKREAARLRNYGAGQPLPPLQLTGQDIVFTVEPSAPALDQAFGLMALCTRVRDRQTALDGKRTRVLLIEPRYGYKEALPWIPIGKGYLAALLRREGFDVRIIDNALHAYDDSALLDRIDEFMPDIIGTGGMTLQMSDTRRIAGLVKTSKAHDALLVGGGVHLTLLPGDGIDLFDLIVLGEGEAAFLELCKRFQETGASKDRKRYTDIPGLCCKIDNALHRTPSRPFIQDLDVLPLPAYDLLEVEKYNDFLITGERAVSVMTGRGCPFDCEFCASPALYQRKVRTFSLDYTFRLIEYLKETYGFTNFRIMDDTFASNIKRVLAFCGEILKRGLKLNMTCLTHVKTADESMFKAMKNAGFTIVALGIESGNDGILKQINKGITRESAIRAIKLAKNAGLLVEGLFMIGNMAETKETIEDTIQFANTYNPVLKDGKRAGFNWFQFATPFPGSRFYEKAEQYGTVASRNFDDYTHQVPVFIPRGLDSDTMVRLREQALRDAGHNRPPTKTREEGSMLVKPDAAAQQNSPGAPLTILHVGWGHPPNLSAGPIYYLHHLCREQRARGMSVSCFVASNDVGDPDKVPMLAQALHDDIPYHIVGNRPAHYFDWSEPRRETGNPAIESLFKQALQTIRPDIVHFHNLVGLSMSLPELAKQSGAATLFSAHNYWMLCPRDDLFAPNEAACAGPGDGARCAGCVGNPDRVVDFMHRCASSRRIMTGSLDMILAVSNGVKRIVAGFGIAEEKIVTSHIGSIAATENWRTVGAARCGVDAVLDKPVAFGFFGAVTARKGAHVVLEAVRRLRNRSGRFTVAIHGYCPPGPYEQRLHWMMEQDTFLKQHVQFKGGYRQHEVPDLSRTIDVAIIPPVWEDNGPQTVMETLGAGLPVLGAAIGGIPDFVQDNGNGLLFRPGDGLDLARAMETVIADPSLIAKMRRNISEPLSMDCHAEQLAELYRQLHADSTSRRPVPLSNQQAGSEAHTRYRGIQTIVADGRMDEAYQELQGLVADFPDFALACNDLGVLSFARGDKDAALAYYRSAVKHDPQNVTFLKNLADLLFVAFGNVIEALPLYIDLAVRMPDDIEVLLALGHASLAMDEYTNAENFYRKVQRLDPTNEQAQQGLAMLRQQSPSFAAPDLLVSSVASRQEFFDHARQFKERYEERAREETAADQRQPFFAVNGYCYVCKKDVDLQVKNDASSGEPGAPPNWREQLVCPHCGMNNRTRAGIHVFEKLFSPRADARIYLAEQITPLFRWMSAHYRNTIGSEFLGRDKTPGSVNRQGIRHEDLTRLSFPDKSFDFVMTFDVFEHIPDYQAAFRESLRVLDDNGTLLFSIPFIKESKTTIVRAVLRPDGSIEHRLPPEIHGDPASPETGLLCYYHFGWELFEELRAAGFGEVSARLYWSRELGYLGNEHFLFIATKQKIAPGSCCCREEETISL